VTLLGEPVTPERTGGGLLIVAGIVVYGLLPRRENPIPAPAPVIASKGA
jgi:hypothetical protein